MICGHDRETLRRVLEFANSSNLDARSRDWSRPNDANGALLYDVHDPAKLAAIIAELMRERGVVACIENGAVYIGGPPCIRVQLGDGYANDSRWHTLTMPQARAFALRLLEATTATTQDVERMIGEL